MTMTHKQPANKDIQVTLEQWQMLDAVVQSGGFQRAAEQLNKSQSTVSYGVRQLQQKLGIQLLEIRGRRAVLTDAGEAVLRRARQLLDQAKALEKASADLAAGWEPEVTLVVDAIFPDCLVAQVLEDFAPESRGSRIEVISSTLSGTQDAVINGQADLAICGQMPTGFLGEPTVEMEFVQIASCNHPLVTQERLVTEDDMRQHRQIVVRDSGAYRRLDAGWLGSRERWTVSNFYQSISLIKQGLGHARLPRHMVEAELADGTIKALRLEAPGKLTYECQLVFAQKHQAGPATQLLAEKIRYRCRQWQWQTEQQTTRS